MKQGSISSVGSGASPQAVSRDETIRSIVALRSGHDMAEPAEEALTIRRLVQALRNHRQRFALIFAVCDHPVSRNELSRRIIAELPDDPPMELRLTGQETSFLERLLLEPGAPRPLIVHGFESLLPASPAGALRRQQALFELQLRREQFYVISRPLVLWMPEYLYSLLGQQAVDFWSWHSGGGFFFASRLAQGASSEKDEAIRPKARPVSNLPQASMVGRHAEQEEIIEALRRGNHVLITGAAGIGKTSLAVGVAPKLCQNYPDAQLFLSLADQGTRHGPLVAGLQEAIRLLQGYASQLDDVVVLAATYRALLSGRRVLVVLDAAPNAEAVAPLLPPPGSVAIVTSRVSLALPGTVSVTLGSLCPSDARELLRGIAPEITVQVADELCALCAYHPLAVRITGALLASGPAPEPATLIRQLRLSTDGGHPATCGEESLWHRSLALAAQGSIDRAFTFLLEALSTQAQTEGPARAKDQLERLRLQPRSTPVVFISSTIEDLQPYREAAKEAAIRAGCLPVLSQYFPASQHERPLDLCRRRAAEADVLVAIVGHRYGWVPQDPNTDEKSITWLECEAAASAGRQILAFLADPDFKGLEEWKEINRVVKASDQGTDIVALAGEVQRNNRKLQSFRTWLSDGDKKFYRKTFKGTDHLALEVYAALEQWQRRQPGFTQTALPAPPTQGDPTRYLQLLRDSTSYIEVRGLKVGTGTATRYPTEEIYIPLTTLRNPEPENKPKSRRQKQPSPERLERARQPVELHHALRSDRLVIVGDPGSGKTTFLRRVALALSQTLLGDDPAAAKKRLGIKEARFPILIKVSELTEHMSARRKEFGSAGRPTTEESPDWLLDFLGAQSHAYSWDLEAEFFRKKMAAGQAMILLDGLDEAPGPEMRRSMSRLFENAVSAYGSCRFVVTTRPRAYTDQAVRLAGFEQADIAPLDAKTMEQSLRRWSQALFPESNESAERYVAELLGALQERPEIRRMATTPVMLTALAVVNWNERKLPEQRADLYESIITWLAEQRAKRQERVSPARCLDRLQDLALAMQQHPEGRKESISRRWAAQAIQHHFRGFRKDERPARSQEFLEEEENDSGIILSRGPDLTFWHPTFREYLAARAIAGKPDPRQYQLLLRDATLYRPEWREVVLLLAGVLAVKQGIGKVEALLSRILGQLGSRATLAAQAPCVGLLGAMVQDLAPLDYYPADPRWRDVLRAVMAIFDAAASQSVPFQDRLDAAEALGQAGDPRLDQDNWVTIPAGSFEMGSSDPEADDDETPHRVSLDSFQIGRYPVTVQEFEQFLRDDGYKKPRWWQGFPEMPGKWTEPRGWADQKDRRNHPVTGVSWFEAVAYCEWLSHNLGSRVRLPTEAEWERAACGGQKLKYPWGDEDPDPSRANYGYEGSPGRTTPVGLYPRGATPEGILDMAGNVWEWVRDRYGKDYYKKAQERNPPGPPSGDTRVVRGVAWLYAPWDLRRSFRSRFLPDARYVYLGFRCAREVIP